MSEVNRYSCAVQVPRKSAPAGTSSMMMVEMEMVPASDYDQLKAVNRDMAQTIIMLRADKDCLTEEAGWLTETLEVTKVQRDKLRTQLAEARELLEEVRTLECRGVDMAHLDAWLEANK